MKTTQFVISAVVLALVPTAAWSDQSISLAPTQDNTIFSESSNSAGGEIGVFVGSNNSAGTPSRRGFIQFNVAGSVPTGVTITGATLTMYLEMANNATARTIDLHRINVAWGEGTAGAGMLNGAGFTAGSGDATWGESMHNVSSWPLGGDFVSAVSASASISGTTVGSAFSWNSATVLSDVQGWYSNASSNHGWEMISNGEGTGGSVKTFYSREIDHSAVRPVLTITYLPEPTTDGLAALAVPLCLTYRRRKT
ncbi:MAG TPA: DNRLRE domain-containing protein [Lacipirellulaceae bacterium]|jgi:hypothetical protein|nr:DNRLRE domain-containing protein [Lacipirellulaceae bacterium]